MKRFRPRFGASLRRPMRVGRPSSTSTKPTTPSTTASATSPPPPPRADTALARLQARLPPRLRPYLAPLLSAPASYTTAFLVLHEITAVVPLAGLFALFHYSDAVWLERWRAGVESSEAFREGVGKWGRYLRRKGWITTGSEEEGGGGGSTEEGEEEGVRAARAVEQVALGGEVEGSTTGSSGSEERHGEGRSEQYEAVGGKPVRVVVELATAWAVTKVLLPARIAVSVWATPAFARVAVLPVSALLRRLLRRG